MTWTFALAAPALDRAYQRVSTRTAPDRAIEEDNVFRVCHLLFRGSVVDLLTFKNREFTQAILETAQPIPEFDDAPFVCPELLLVTQLLRPTRAAAIAAVELLVARLERGDFCTHYAAEWADAMGKRAAFDRAWRRAQELMQGESD